MAMQQQDSQSLAGAPNPQLNGTYIHALLDKPFKHAASMPAPDRR
jgi:hypothetical protein